MLLKPNSENNSFWNVPLYEVILQRKPASAGDDQCLLLHHCLYFYITAPLIVYCRGFVLSIHVASCVNRITDYNGFCKSQQHPSVILIILLANHSSGCLLASPECARLFIVFMWCHTPAGCTHLEGKTQPSATDHQLFLRNSNICSKTLLLNGQIQYTPYWWCICCTGEQINPEYTHNA